MPRAGRSFEEGRIYQVYNRVGAGAEHREMAAEVRGRGFLELACEHLGCDREKLRARGRSSEVVRMRELIGLVGIERYGVKVTELAWELGKWRDGVSRWYRRGTIRRAEDSAFSGSRKGSRRCRE